MDRYFLTTFRFRLSSLGLGLGDRIIICFIASISFNEIDLSWAAISPEGAQKTTLVEGFRSAKFGLTESELYIVIQKDFNIDQKFVERNQDPMEKTTSLAFTVPQLIEEVGKARVAYILGYKSKKLIQVNVTWGHPVDFNPEPRNIVDAANVLRTYFFLKGFEKNSIVMNAKLDDGWVLMFQGSDSKGRMVMLLLKTPSSSKEDRQVKANEFSLRLLYIQDPKNPDIFKIDKEGF